MTIYPFHEFKIIFTAFNAFIPCKAATAGATDSLRQVLDKLEEALDGGAGFVFTGWGGDPAVEEEVKERTKATIRVLVSDEFRSEESPDKCLSGKSASVHEVAWARAY